MCGIAGAFQQLARQIVEKMVSRISHRDPDGQCVMNIPSGTFGHTHPAILDV